MRSEHTRLLTLPATLMALFLCSACATEQGYRSNLEKYKGMTEQQLISVWGEPDKVIDGTNGMRGLRYNKIRRYTVVGMTTDSTMVTNHSGIIYTPNGTSAKYSGYSQTSVPIKKPDREAATFCVTSFLLNKERRVVDYNFIGPDCTATE